MATSPVSGKEGRLARSQHLDCSRPPIAASAQGSAAKTYASSLQIRRSARWCCYPAMDAAGLHGFHASELPYMFGRLDRTPPLWPRVPDTAVESGLSDVMIDYWTSFARTGAPAAAGGPEWAAFGEAGGWMIFRETPIPAVDPMAGMFALHEQAMCRRRAGGGLAWNWNVGLMSPGLPAASEACRRAGPR